MFRALPVYRVSRLWNCIEGNLALKFPKYFIGIVVWHHLESVLHVSMTDKLLEENDSFTFLVYWYKISCVQNTRLFHLGLNIVLQTMHINIQRIDFGL